MQKEAEQKKINAEYHRKELLIEQARLAYMKKQSGVVEAPVVVVSCKYFFSKKEVLKKKKKITWSLNMKFFFLFILVDVESPDFDFEKFVAQYEKENN